MAEEEAEGSLEEKIEDEPIEHIKQKRGPRTQTQKNQKLMPSREAHRPNPLNQKMKQKKVEQEFHLRSCWQGENPRC